MTKVPKSQMQSTVASQANKEDVYISLMEMYPGLTPALIADMNPYVQHVLQRGKRIRTLSDEEAKQFMTNKQRH